MGFDVDRFDEEVNEGLLCSICHDVLEDAVQAPCEHAFCSQCIQAWLLEDNSCPVDRQILLSSELTPLHRYMRNDLNSLQIKCKYSSVGCQQKLNLEAVLQHESECCYQQQCCPICHKTITKQELHQHLQICNLRNSQLISAVDVSKMLEEMRQQIENLKDEFTAKISEQKVEMDLRLDAQRRHLVQRENSLQEQLDEMRRMYARQDEELKRLILKENQTKTDLQRMAQEKVELLRVLQQKMRIPQSSSSSSSTAGISQKFLPEKVTDL